MSKYAIEYEGRAFTPDGEMPTPASVDEYNRALSAQEVTDFKERKSDRWFAYWKPAEDPSQWVAAQNGPTIRTWMGDLLATVYWTGDTFKCYGFGSWPSTRMNFRARGIDGRHWAGTYYKSSGDYVRMRVTK